MIDTFGLYGTAQDTVPPESEVFKKCTRITRTTSFFLAEHLPADVRADPQRLRRGARGDDLRGPLQPGGRDGGVRVGAG